MRWVWLLLLMGTACEIEPSSGPDLWVIEKAEKRTVTSTIHALEWFPSGAYSLLRMSGVLRAEADVILDGIRVYLKWEGDKVSLPLEGHERKNFPNELSKDGEGAFSYQGWFRLASVALNDPHPVVSIQWRYK